MTMRTPQKDKRNGCAYSSKKGIHQIRSIHKTHDSFTHKIRQQNDTT